MENNINNSQEIDLVFLIKKIKEFFYDIKISFFNLLKFINEKKFILLGLLVVGFLAGFLIDKFAPSNYESEVVIVPNFNSTDYLYDKVEFINQSDRKGVYQGLVSVKVKEIKDDYALVQNNSIEVYKLLSQDGKDFKTLKQEKDFNKKYRYHVLNVITKNKENANQIIKQLLKDLNQSEYYEKRAEQDVKSYLFTKNQMLKSIDQINKIMDQLGDSNLSNSTNSNLNITTYSELRDVIDLKKYYTDEIAKLDVKILESSQIIKPLNIFLNINKVNLLYFSWKLVLPIIFLVTYILWFILSRFYTKYDLIIKSQRSDQ